MISSAVEGLAPEIVAVLDMRGNLLNRREADHGNAADDIIGLRLGIPPQSGAGSYRQTEFDPGASGGRGQISRRRLRRVRFDQRRAERRKFRPEPLRHGHLPKDRGYFFHRRIWPRGFLERRPISPRALLVPAPAGAERRGKPRTSITKPAARSSGRSSRREPSSVFPFPCSSTRKVIGKARAPRPNAFSILRHRSE